MTATDGYRASLMERLAVRPLPPSVSRLLGRDSPADFARVVLLVVGFLALGRVIDRLIAIRPSSVLEPVLVWEAVTGHPQAAMRLITQRVKVG